jgi:hypothetical protein
MLPVGATDAENQTFHISAIDVSHSAIGVSLGVHRVYSFLTVVMTTR